MFFLESGDMGSWGDVLTWLGGVGALWLYSAIPIYERDKVIQVGQGGETEIKVNQLSRGIRFNLWSEGRVERVEWHGFVGDWRPEWNELRLFNIKNTTQGEVRWEAAGRQYGLRCVFGIGSRYYYPVSLASRYFRCRERRGEHYCLVADVPLGYLAGALLDTPEQGSWGEVLERLCHWVERVESGMPVRTAAKTLSLPMPLVRWSGWHGNLIRNVKISAYQQLCPILAEKLSQEDIQEDIKDVLVLDKLVAKLQAKQLSSGSKVMPGVGEIIRSYPVGSRSIAVLGEIVASNVAPVLQTGDERLALGAFSQSNSTALNFSDTNLQR